MIEHPDDELPGVIGERFVEVGLPLERFAVAGGGPLPDPRDFAAVVVLGSIESVYDDRVPWVAIADELPRFGGPTGTEPR